MSRIGKKVVLLPKDVKIRTDGRNVIVKGPKGELSRYLSSRIQMKQEGNKVTFIRPDDSKEMKTIHGTTRANFNNMVVGVSVGFKKELELRGVGYRVQLKGKNLELNLGKSHQDVVKASKGITFTVLSATSIVVEGANKEIVGQTAAYIRSLRPPEPYKGKGVRYVGEFVKRKEGKTGK
ncbi:MAG: 50S ribosomal protein L6 [Streptococcaceae bacterium]|jgi:large subunit ribosomal protein L6|nr:50S ribosomal protein L6 [Streptococcaceae bacterium]